MQLAKAGVMEVAHVFVVNKKDQPGAEDLVRMLQALLPSPSPQTWRPPVVPVQATTGEGVEELLAALQAHQRFLAEHGHHEELRWQRAERRLASVLAEMLQQKARSQRQVWQEAVGAVAFGREDVVSAAEKLLQYLREQP
ncbi:MAG: hypothetical protein N2447_07155 [Thermoanaerobaculum sp.]|nr:hypothetical protein [Thermoanaerobaculum sp.]